MFWCVVNKKEVYNEGMLVNLICSLCPLPAKKWKGINRCRFAVELESLFFDVSKADVLPGTVYGISILARALVLPVHVLHTCICAQVPYLFIDR